MLTVSRISKKASYSLTGRFDFKGTFSEFDF